MQFFMMVPETTIKIGVSSCLVGQKVRYDATDKRDSYVADTLADAFVLVPLCPEVAVGLGVPRAPIRLEGEPARPRAIGVYDKNIDATERLQSYGRETARQLRDINGYIFKSKSPSCAVQSVRIYRGDRVIERGTGLFAREIRQLLPLLPVVEETDLGDRVARDNFIERVFAYRRWQDLMQAPLSYDELQRFQRRHTLLLMSHGRGRYRALDRFLSEGRAMPLAKLAEEYGERFMHALKYPATVRRHANVLRYAVRRLNPKLDSADRDMLLARIEAYREGKLPLAAAMLLVREMAQRTDEIFLNEQYYLHPSPVEWRLREKDRLEASEEAGG